MSESMTGTLSARFSPLCCLFGALLTLFFHSVRDLGPLSPSFSSFSICTPFLCVQRGPWAEKRFQLSTISSATVRTMTIWLPASHPDSQILAFILHEAFATIFQSLSRTFHYTFYPSDQLSTHAISISCISSPFQHCSVTVAIRAVISRG